MADTYTTASKARKIQDATRTGTWGPVINSDSLELMDDAAIGYEAINIGVATTYSMAAISNGTDSETRAAYWKFSGTPASAVAVIVPVSLTTKAKRVDNSTGQTLTVGYSAGTTVTLPNGTSAVLWFTGTDVVFANGAKGTWTPSVGGTATYTAQQGHWAVINGVVFVHGRLTINAIGSGSTTTVSGLPFTCHATIFGGCCVDGFTSSASSITALMMRIDAGTTNIQMRSLTAAGASVAANAIFQNSTDVIFHGSYPLP